MYPKLPITVSEASAAIAQIREGTYTRTGTRTLIRRGRAITVDSPINEALATTASAPMVIDRVHQAVKLMGIKDRPVADVVGDAVDFLERIMGTTYLQVMADYGPVTTVLTALTVTLHSALVFNLESPETDTRAQLYGLVVGYFALQVSPSSPLDALRMLSERFNAPWSAHQHAMLFTTSMLGGATCATMH